MLKNYYIFRCDHGIVAALKKNTPYLLETHVEIGMCVCVCTLLYCNIHFIVIVWNQTHSASKVCLCVIFAHSEVFMEEMVWVWGLL